MLLIQPLVIDDVVVLVLVKRVVAKLRVPLAGL